MGGCSWVIFKHKYPSNSPTSDMSAGDNESQEGQQPSVNAGCGLPVYLERSWNTLQLELRRSIAANLKRGKSLSGRYYYYNGSPLVLLILCRFSWPARFIGWTTSNLSSVTKSAILTLTGIIYFGDLCRTIWSLIELLLRITVVIREWSPFFKRCITLCPWSGAGKLGIPVDIWSHKVVSNWNNKSVPCCVDVLFNSD